MTEHDHASAPITFAIITCSDTRGMSRTPPARRSSS